MEKEYSDLLYHIKFMENVKEKNNSAKVGPQVSGWSTEEKAQFEVYRNGSLSRDTIAKWIRNDLGAIASFVHGVMTDEKIFGVLTDAYFERYKKLHEEKSNGKEVKNES